MSYELKITGSSLAELAKNAAAIAAQLGGKTANVNEAADTADKPTPPKPAAPKPAAPKAPAPQEPETAALDYAKDVAPLVLQVAAKSRDKAVAILKGFGVAKATELKPEQWPELVEKLNAALEDAELA